MAEWSETAFGLSEVAKRTWGPFVRKKGPSRCAANGSRVNTFMPLAFHILN